MSVQVQTVLGCGLIVEVPEAEPVVGELRRRLDGNARLGIPAHLTVLFPFLPPASIEDGVLGRLERVFSAGPVLEQSLVRTGWFGDDVLWLAPEDDAPIRSLTDAVHREFSAYPPFGGQFEDVVPHLTIADRRPLDQMQSAERLVLRHLPIRFLAREVSLWVQHDSSGSWTRSATFALGSDPPR